MAALGFIAFLLLGFVATMAYVAGRVARSAGPPITALPGMRPARVPEAPTASAIKVPEVERKKPAVEQLIMVEAAAPGTPVPPPTMAAQPAEPPPAPAGVVSPGKAPELRPVAPELLAGNTFWQVAATERGMAEVTCEFLTRRGLPAVLGDSPSPGIFRVLVGPIQTPDETSRHKANLDAAGFHPFIKKY